MKTITQKPIQSALMVVCFALSAFSLNAQATLSSYTANGKDLVYSSVSDVTWTKDGNLLGTLFATQGFNTVVNAIKAANAGVIISTPNRYSPSGSHTIDTAFDFSSDGKTSWFGAVAYVNYLNSINYAGSDKWYLPTVANTTYGFNTTTNGTAKGDELVEMFYSELNGTAGSNIPNTAKFDNEQSYTYWSGTDEPSDPGYALFFNSYFGFQSFGSKNFHTYAWAVSPGQIASLTPVPEAESSALLLVGLGVAAVVRRQKFAV